MVELVFVSVSENEKNKKQKTQMKTTLKSLIFTLKINKNIHMPRIKQAKERAEKQTKEFVL